MRLINKNGLSCLEFPALADLPGLFHGIFLRDYMKEQGSVVDFNLGLKHGASEDFVWQNRKKMLGSFGSGLYGVYARQIHGCEVGIIKEPQQQHVTKAHNPIRLDGDALITDACKLALVIQVADCQPVLIMDPVKRVVANIHSGWRGSVQNIIGVTVRQMISEFECRPENMVCGIGPSLGPCCAEFVNYKSEIPESYWKYRSSDDLFDFWQISVDQLIDAGARPYNIHLANMCTKCNQHLFFSYRGEKDTGRFASVIGFQS